MADLPAGNLARVTTPPSLVLSEESARRLADLRAKGCTIFGPGPASFTEGVARPDAGDPAPGMRVQIGVGRRLIEGTGPTADAAVSDALFKLEGYPVEEWVRG
jgi:hypothetical protein